MTSQLSKLDRLKLKPLRFWDNLSLKNKLLLLIAVTTIVPTFVVTQRLVNISENNFTDKLKDSLKNRAKVFKEQFVINAEVPEEAENIAVAIEKLELDLSLAKSDREIQKSLQTLVLLDADGHEEEKEEQDNLSSKHLSFKIITDASGKTIAQSILVLEDNDPAPKLSNNEEELEIQEYRSVDLPTGIPLNDIPIVKEATETGKFLTGVELIDGEPLAKLGLSEQATIATRPQVIKGLPPAKQPAPTGTYNIDNSKAGLVNMAVHPIKDKDGKVIGTAIVGTLLNRNFQLVDDFHNNYNAGGVATIVAKDWRIATNVPYVDPNAQQAGGKQAQQAKVDGTRSIGTFLAKEVGEAVLDGDREFVGKTNIAGLNYFTTYLPLYDHSKKLNSQAKPVGIAFVGQPLAGVERSIQQQQLFGYGIGGGISIVFLILALPLASTISRPLSNLASLAKNIEGGTNDVKIPVAERNDEIGLLNNALSSLIDNLAANQEQLRQESEQRRQQTEIIQNEAENLTMDVGQLLEVVSALEDGDFTIEAEVSDRATGLVADTLNRLIEQLATTLANVVTTVRQMTASADDLEQLSLSTAQQAQEQAQSVSDIRDLVMNVNNISQNTAEQALISNGAVKEARDAIDRGEEEILSMSEEIDVLQDGTQQIVKRAETLGEFVALAAQFAEDQKRTAALTRVLALNASMVASRASAQEDPEQFIVITKEFETIAQQINDLAVQTNQGLLRLKQRTDQIETVVSGITQDIQEIDRAVGQFDLSVQNSRQIFNNIKEVTEKVDRVGREVTNSSVSIAQLTETALRSVEDIAKAATETQHSSQFTNEQASLMDNLAQTLLERVNFFRLKQSR
jgi:methyl-accepting chemotaxis protein